MAADHEANSQVKLECIFCDKSEKVHSYCWDCMENFCDDCIKQHTKLHEDHEVVEDTVGILEQQRFVVLCKSHSKRFRFYCEICKINICIECVTADHKGHCVQKVSEHSKILKDNIKQEINTQQRRLFTIQKNLRSLKQHKSNFVKEIEKQMEFVRTETNKKRTILDIEEHKIIESLKHEQKMAKKILRRFKKELQDIDDKIKKIINSINNELRFIPSAAVLQFVRDSEPKLKFESINKTVELPNSSIFIPSNPRCQDNSLLGDLKKNKNTRLVFEIFTTNKQTRTESDQQSTSLNQLDSLEVIQRHIPLDPPPSLRRDLHIINNFLIAHGDYITDVCSTADDLFWAGTSRRLLFLVDKKIGIKRRIEMPGYPCYIAVTCRGDVIVFTEGHVVYHVTRQGDISLFVDLSPYTVLGITTTRQGDVFACVRDSDSGCKVQKFTAEGDFVLEMDKDLFTTSQQFCVHTVPGDTVCIHDGDPLADDVCNLTFVDAVGHVVSRVKQTEQLRKQRVKVWDGHGHIMSSSVLSECIQVLSVDGTCKQIYQVKESKGIRSLCLSRDDDMLIGTQAGKVIVAKYLQ